MSPAPPSARSWAPWSDIIMGRSSTLGLPARWADRSRAAWWATTAPADPSAVRIPVPRSASSPRATSTPPAVWSARTATPRPPERPWSPPPPHRAMPPPAGATIGASIREDDSGTSNNPSSVTDVYYDNTVNPTASISGVGANNPFGPPQVTVHGLSTTALQDGALPSGFNTAISAPNNAGSTPSATTSTTAWFAVSGAYPVLTFPSPHGPIAIQGTVFNGYDTSPVGTGLTVALSSYGSVEGSTQTHSSGAHTLGAVRA